MRYNGKKKISKEANWKWINIEVAKKKLNCTVQYTLDWLNSVLVRLWKNWNDILLIKVYIYEHILKNCLIQSLILNLYISWPRNLTPICILDTNVHLCNPKIFIRIFVFYNYSHLETTKLSINSRINCGIFYIILHIMKMNKLLHCTIQIKFWLKAATQKILTI